MNNFIINRLEHMFNVYHHVGERQIPNIYTDFPPEQKSAPGTVAASFGASPLLPEYRVNNGNDPILWITDAKFIPYHDNMLITCVGGYRERPGMTNVGLNERVNGLICRWTFEGSSMDCDIKRGTDSKATPHVYPLKDGLGFIHINRGKLVFKNLMGKKINQEAGLSTHNNIRYFAVSQKTNTLAYIHRMGCEYSFTIYRKDSVIVFHNTVKCRDLCSSFIGTRAYTEEAECSWSPDEHLISLSSSNGHLLIIEAKSLKLKCGIIPGLFDIDDKPLSSVRSYAFHPLCGHDVVAFCCKNNVIYICDIENEKIVNERTLEPHYFITSVQYNNEATNLFLATSEAFILALDPFTLDTIYTLDGVAQGPHSFPEPNPNHAIIYRMNFSTFDDYMATSSSDGIIRIWTLCKENKLEDICRKRIMSLVPATKVDQLPLPDKIKDFLLQKKDFEYIKTSAMAANHNLSELRIRLF